MFHLVLEKSILRLSEQKHSDCIKKIKVFRWWRQQRI